jgi:iron complex outermembrane recepter protein
MRKDTRRELRRAVAVVLAAAVAAPAAWGQAGPQLEEIIVTAQKREETLREVPISVSATTGEAMADAGIVRLDNLKAYVPNLQVTETGIANNMYVRGIGSGQNQGFEQSVSIYSDGIYRGRGHQSRMPFLDLERIEVLRGPQPILFGKNAIAGAINMISAKPTAEFEGSARLSYEFETEESIADLVLSGPFSDTFGARLAVRYRETDGYIKNLTLDRSEPQREELSGRLTLAFTPSDNFDATLKVESGQFDVDGRQVEIFGELPAAPVRRPNGTTSVPPIPGLTYSQILGLAFGQDASVANNTLDYQRSANGDFSYIDMTEAALTMNWRFGDLTLTSVTGYSEYELDELCDCDFTGGSVIVAGLLETYDQFSQELRLSSGTDQRLSWIAGLFYQDYDLEAPDFVLIPSDSIIVPLVNQLAGPGAGNAMANTANPRIFEQSSELFAVFAQVSYELTDALRLTAGGRWSTEDKTGLRANDLTLGVGGPSLAPGLIDALWNNVLAIQRHSVEGKRSEDNFSPLVNLQYRFGDDSMAYLSWARGFKSGGYDARSNKSPANGGTFEYKPEEADSYELGVKWGLGGRAEINAAIFYTDYTDLQTSAFDGTLGFNVGNGSAEVSGLELEGRWQATDKLYLFGTLSYLDFEWKTYDGQCYFNPPPEILGINNPGRVAGNCVFDGFRNNQTPEFTAALGADFRQPVANNLEFRAAVDVTYTDDFLTSLTLDPNSSQDSYTKVNGRLSLGTQDGRWEAAVIGRNLTDEQTISFAGEAPLSGSIFSARSYYGFVDLPRTYALELVARF